MKTNFSKLSPEWPQLPQVRAFTTISSNLVSENIDIKDKRHKNALEEAINQGNSIHWLRQVHQGRVIELPQSTEIEADGSTTATCNTICAILTADCLPVVFTDLAGTRVGVAHAGWRGLHAHILLRMIEKFEAPSSDLLVWIGPGIAVESYEVGPELRTAFLSLDRKYDVAFAEKENGKFMADLYLIARIQLEDAGIPAKQISGAEWDTFMDLRLHSFRRDGAASGRMATVVWMG